MELNSAEKALIAPPQASESRHPGRRVVGLLAVVAAHPVAALGLWWADRAQLFDTLGWSRTPGLGILGYFLLLGFVCAGCRVPFRRLAAVLAWYGLALGVEFVGPWVSRLVDLLPVQTDLVALITAVAPVLVASALVYELPRVPWLAKPAFWLAGIYLIAVHLYNGLDPYEHMGLFGAGEVI